MNNFIIYLSTRPATGQFCGLYLTVLLSKFYGLDRTCEQLLNSHLDRNCRPKLSETTVVSVLECTEPKNNV